MAEYVLTGWVAPVFDDGLCDGFGCALGDAFLAVATDETCAAGDWVGVVVCP